MNIFQFMSGNPWLSFFVVIVIVFGIATSIRFIMTGLSIMKNGYPPAHCDGLGSSKTDDEE